eukprot:TRINITY_DN37995_c0_g1_i1.p1 TRINITY_DN37995_c0_g1~~TRINITY_DN37995_c0_g1_i1.p1  ORF type:complete len:359 (+),score=51.76 TRINITY_DN37995_c0_g1_i1:34-1110(+)
MASGASGAGGIVTEAKADVQKVKSEVNEVKTEAYAQATAFSKTSCGEVLFMLCHFIFTQCRPILMFYVSTSAYQALVVDFQVLHSDMITPEIEEAARGPTNSSSYMDLNTYFTCVQQEARTLDQHFQSPMKTACLGTIGNFLYKLPVTDNFALSCLNTSCLVIVAVFTLVMVVEILRSGANGFGHGRYIAYTWEIEQTLAHKICSCMVIAYCVVLFTDFGWFVARTIKSRGISEVVLAIKTMLPPLLGLFAASWSLFHPSNIPNVDFESSAFKEIRFRRPLKLIHQDNSAFFDTVKAAIHDYEHGVKSELLKYCGGGYSEPVYVIAACKVADLKPKADPAAHPLIAPTAPSTSSSAGP